MFVGLLCSAGSGVMQPLNMLIFGTLTQIIIDYASIIMSGASPTDEQKEVFFDGITTFAIQNTLIGVGMFAFSYLSTVLFNYSALRQSYRVRTLFFQKTMNQDIGWFDVNQTGDFASRMSE